MPEPKPEKYALINVTDKTGVVELAYALVSLGYKIVAAGGTYTTLKQSELEVLQPQDIAASPDVLEGTLGLLHPRLLIGVAADRDHPGHMHELERRKAVPVDLVAVNLYPMAEITAEKDLPQGEMLNYVDVGSAAILRAAARNFKHVIALCDPDDYQPTVDSLRQYGRLLPDRRQALASKAFHYLAYYDTTVAQYLGGRWDRLPDELVIGLKKAVEFPYGENPQQQGALYTLSGSRPRGINAASHVYGKPLSYNHCLDLEVAWELANELDSAACAIVKHSVPSGVAAAESLAEAAKLAYRCDPRGGFRGTAAVNREVTDDAAAFFAEEYVTCIAAPAFSINALDILKTKKDIRLVILPPLVVSAHEIDFQAVAGGMLVQDRDNGPLFKDLKAVSRRHPDEAELKSLRLAWLTAKHSRSHAAVVCRGSATIGIGSGQTSRLDSINLALAKSQERHPILPAGQPLVLASDGPLSAEHIQAAASAGITAFIESGGSSEDKDAVAFCDSKNLSLVFTGVRHFKH
ncbi:MAG: bifunctional phosphoribosylaminoimidazolecarboxamide formyltransferase/IMP cyclohydrolase [Elusimicrobia bacterium]|nr:bifunctional phosphoribosylaminoimidazolecarboxamide formyltransferase/IMP cyclohydrolase [Elusimicrobiota bacterium]